MVNDRLLGRADGTESEDLTHAGAHDRGSPRTRSATMLFWI